MNKFIATCSLMLLTASVAVAQQFSAGLRTGMSSWTQKYYWIEDEYQKFYPYERDTRTPHYASWDVAAFVRKEGKGRWAFEGGISSSRSTDKTEGNATTIFGDSYDYKGTTRARAAEINLSVQYEIGRNGTPWSVKRKIRSYVGIIVCPSWTQVDFTLDYKYRHGGDYQQETFEEDVFNLWAGLNHTIVYDAGKHLSFSLVTEIKAATIYNRERTNYHYYYDPVARGSMRVGAAYRF